MQSISISYRDLYFLSKLVFAKLNYFILLILKASISAFKKIRDSISVFFSVGAGWRNYSPNIFTVVNLKSIIKQIFF